MTNPLDSRVAVLGLLASVAFATAPAAPAGAVSQPPAKFFVQPAGGSDKSFRFSTAPGARVRGAVRVVNDSRETKKIRLTAADVSTFPAGGVKYGEAAPRATGTWLRLDRPVVSVPARSAVTVGFAAQIPERVRGGFHYAGIVAGDVAATARPPRTKSKDGRGEIRVRQVVRFALPVRLGLPGPLSTKLALSDVGTKVDAAGLALVLRLRNVGNTLVRETALDVTVSGEAGTVLRYRGKLGPFVPGSAIPNLTRWRKPPGEGRYRVLGTVRPAGGPEVRIDRYITISKRDGKALEEQSGQEPAPSTSTPVAVWVALGLAALLALASVTGYVRMRRRLRHATASAL